MRCIEMVVTRVGKEFTWWLIETWDVLKCERSYEKLFPVAD